MSSLKLKSNDGEVFEVNVDVAKVSGTIRTMLESGLLTSPNGNDIVPLPNVSSTVLRKILIWATHHKDDYAKFNEDYYKYMDFDEWEKEYLQIDKGFLFELVLAANYMEVKGLERSCCSQIANMMKGKNVEEIRKIFNIKKDFTTAEEESVISEVVYDEP